MKTKILIMRPDEPHETREVELPAEPNESRRVIPPPISKTFYTELRELVEAIVGQPMEHVTVWADFSGGTDYRRADMFVNEFGHVLATGPLPRNGAATDIYRRNALLNQGFTDPEDLPWIAGPAVLFEKIVWR